VFLDALDLSYSLPLLVFGWTSLPICSWKNKSVAKVFFLGYSAIAEGLPMLSDKSQDVL
jgi:hypothetical protein